MESDGAPSFYVASLTDARSLPPLQEADQNTIVWNRPECDITEQVKNQLEAAVGAPKSAASAAASSPLANLGDQAINAARPQQRSAAGSAQLQNVAPTAPRASTATAPNAATRR